MGSLSDPGRQWHLSYRTKLTITLLVFWACAAPALAWNEPEDFHGMKWGSRPSCFAVPIISVNMVRKNYWEHLLNTTTLASDISHARSLFRSKVFKSALLSLSSTINLAEWISPLSLTIFPRWKAHSLNVMARRRRRRIHKSKIASEQLSIKENYFGRGAISSSA